MDCDRKSSEISIEQKIKRFFDPYCEIPVEVWQFFLQYLHPCSFCKNEIMKQADSQESHLHLVLSGSAGLFVYKDGHDICIDLCYEGQFTGDYYSLLLQQNNVRHSSEESEISQLLCEPSPIYVMALEPLETLAITKSNLFELYDKSEMGGKIARMVAEILYLQKQHQQVELLTQTAEQRYLNLLRQQPRILQRTANKHIASYLGITPESFSRIRKNVFL